MKGKTNKKRGPKHGRKRPLLMELDSRTIDRRTKTVAQPEPGQFLLSPNAGGLVDAVRPQLTNLARDVGAEVTGHESQYRFPPRGRIDLTK